MLFTLLINNTYPKYLLQQVKVNMPVITRSQAKNIQSIIDARHARCVKKVEFANKLSSLASATTLMIASIPAREEKYQKLKQALEKLEICQQRLTEHILKQREKKV
jgi:hypothetical protein